MSDFTTDSASPPTVGTVRSLARLYLFAKPAVPRLIAGTAASLLSSLMALFIPQVLRGIVDGPLTSGNEALLWPAVGLVLVLGVLEAGLFALRRFFALIPTTKVEASM